MTPDRIVQAGGGADAFVWIILAVFWVVAQVISKAARRLPPSKPQSPPQPHQPRGAMPSELQAFLNSLAQAQKEATEPPPLDKPLRPIPYGQTVAPPPPPPSQQQVRRKHKPKTAQRATLTLADIQSRDAAAPPAVEPAVVWHGDQHSRVAPAQKPDLSRHFLAATEKAFRIKTPSMTTTGQHRKTNSQLQKMLTGKAALRQAMLSRIVLGPPKAFS